MNRDLCDFLKVSCRNRRSRMHRGKNEMNVGSNAENPFMNVHNAIYYTIIIIIFIIHILIRALVQTTDEHQGEFCMQHDIE